MNDRASRTLDRPSSPAPADTPAADPLSAVLRAVRLTGSLYFMVDATSPWCVDVPPVGRFANIIHPGAQHVISYHMVLEGAGFASVRGAPPVRFGAGDVIVFPHGDAYLMQSAPDAPPEHDPAATLAFFRALVAGVLPFVVSEGGGAPPPAKFICGFLGCDLEPFNPILPGLPRLLHLRRSNTGGSDLLARLVALTLEEAQAPRDGGRSVRLALSELMFVELLRCWARTAPASELGWLAGLREPAVARALELIHERPTQEWTVASLATAVGLSRSALAQRFVALVGHRPATYLTLWRMQMAAELLATGRMPVSEVGFRIGYGSEAAFSRAFKRVVGVSPQEWRRNPSSRCRRAEGAGACAGRRR